MTTDPSAANTPNLSQPSSSASASYTDSTVVYQSLLSARSRRLRVTGIVLLIMVLGMTLYGCFALMPSLRTLPRIASKTPVAQAISPATERAGGVSRAGTQTSNSINAPRTGQTLRASGGLTEHERKAALARVLFAYGYWSVCGVLILALIIVSWLDFRELGRAYDAQRARLLAQSLAESGQE